MNRVVVLGCNSFLGSWMVNYLLDNNIEVLGVSRSKKDILAHNPNHKHFYFNKIDINKETNKLISTIDSFKPDTIINYAALCMVGQSWIHPEEYMITNAVSLAKIASELSGKKYLDRFIQTSTPEVYGSVYNNIEENRDYKPSTPYGASKAAADIYLHMMYEQKEFPVMYTRIANCYGPYQQLYRIIPKTIIKIKKKEKLPLHGGGISKRYFIDIRDATEGTLKSIEGGRIGDIYHFSSDDYYSIKDLVKLICNKMDYDYNSLVNITDDIIGKDDEYSISSKKANKELNWKPTRKLSESVDDVIEWIEKDWSSIKDMDCEYKWQK